MFSLWYYIKTEVEYTQVEEQLLALVSTQTLPSTADCPHFSGY